ncbi:MAG TPA: CopD family protein [Gemmatimonadales bacterium]|jgi:putative copper export protein
MSSALLALYAVVRGVVFVGLLLLVGAQAAGALLGQPRRDPDLADPLHRRLDRMPRWLLALLIAAVLARGALQLLSLLDPGDVVTLDLVYHGLLSGSWGHAWLLQVVAAAIALGLLSYRGDRVSVPDPFTIVLIALMLWAQTGMGHAAGDNWPGPVGRLLDLTHLVGIGIWLGTLAVLTFAAVPLLGHASRLPTLAAVVREFSVYARVGAALAVASGATAALVYTGGSIGILTQSTWGRLLIIKVACMCGVLAVGWYNWKIVTPALEGLDADCRRRLRRAISVELALGLLMLAITTVLVASPLPGEG